MLKSARLVASLIWACLIAAAGTAGWIEGVVRDPAGAVIVGAAIHVTDASSGAIRSLLTDGAGRYVVLELPPGTYTVEVQHPGFRTGLRRGVDVPAGGMQRADILLELGESRERVEVREELPLVRSGTAEWGRQLEPAAVEALPLNGRDMFDLAILVPGASIAYVAERSISTPGIQVSSNGARPGQNSFRLDGIEINAAGGGAPASAGGQLLGLETIRELRVVTEPFSAEYGRLAGAAIIAVSRTGSNDWHGAVYEFFRNSALDAKNYFDSPGDKIPPLRRNQFGALLAGPLLRDRVLLMTNYEAVRDRRGQTATAAVPTAAARQGILPQAGPEQKIAVAPFVAPYLALYPLPNGRDHGDGTADFVSELAQTTREDYGALRLDVLISPSLRWSARYTGDDADQGAPDPMHVWRHQGRSRYQFAHQELQWVASPRTVHSVRVAFSRVLNSNSSNVRPDAPGSLAFVPGQSLGSMIVAGLSDMGYPDALLNPRFFVTNNYQANYDVVHARGSISWRAGAGFDRSQFNQLSSRGAVGHYRFASLADFLGGRAAAGEVMLPGSIPERGWRQNLGYAFVQADWRARANLSVGAGLRYEPAGTPGEVNGLITTLRDPLRDTDVAVGGPLFRNPSRFNLAPRLSLAWDPWGAGRLVMRAGAGVFHDLLGSRELVIAGARMPPFYNRAILTNPEFPNVLRAAQTVTPAKSLDGLDWYQEQPRVLRYQFTISGRVWKDTAAEISYTGARGLHLPGYVGNVNAPQPEIRPDGSLYFPVNAPRLNPNFEQIALRRTQFNSFYQALSAEIRRNWTSGLGLQGKYTWGKSIDETSSSIYKEFFNSDLMPTMLNYRQNRGLSDFDARHVFAAAASWQPGRGWELSGMAQVRSGHPFSPRVGFDRARLRPGSTEVGQRPDFVAPPGAPVITGDSARYFDPFAFALPAAGTYGNLGRNVFEGPGLFGLDVALQKALWQQERKALRIRVECFNATNHPNFLPPSGLNLFNGTLARLGSAGQITDTSTNSRQLQVALRLVF